jgi:hypothetical protein
LFLIAAVCRGLLALELSALTGAPHSINSLVTS